MTALAKEKCEPCESGTGKLERKEIESLLETVDGWQIVSLNAAIEKNWDFKNFKQALAFANQIGELAETEGHHPDITVGWGYVMVSLTTHSVQGLTRNDFIMAAKIDGLQAK